jgi:hypothetical protein
MVRFHHGFLDSLEAVRVELDLPMPVMSGCRCLIHNAAVGGHQKSLHVCDHEQHPGQEGTLGVDVATPDGAYRGKLFAIAWKHGFSIGWNAAKRFLHLDRRDLVGLPQTSFDY